VRNRACCVIVANLVGAQLPDIALQASDGSWINLSKLPGHTVVFCYPFTGRPGHPNPPDWDNIPGAHGSTPQALAYSATYATFKMHQIKVFGLSFQTVEWQQDFATRNALPFLMLSDVNQAFSKALGLDTFQAGDQRFLTRRTLVITSGLIQNDIYPVLNPANNAQDVLSLFTP
jgi:peroxiredoxin